MNIIPIAFAFDEKLIRPACVCLTSLLENANADSFYNVYIITKSVKSQVKILLLILYQQCPQL